MEERFFFVALSILCAVEARRSFFVPGSNAGCGYNSCPGYNSSAKINVHLVPHSHDDVGWLKTIDQYYFGSKMNIQRAGVQYIIDSVIKELSLDPQKRFIQVETAFFWRWWNEQNEEMKSITRRLVEEGRLEFVGAGWSMNDEATTHYSAIIDNMAVGFKTLYDVFGECSIPRVAWQIDPFGHSREQAQIFARLGFDGLFFARADFRDKDQRKANKTLQMIWHGSGREETHEGNSIFTGMFTNHYSNPRGLCFDILCVDDPVIDNEELEGYNVNEEVALLLENIQDEVSNFEGPSAKHIMFTMGDDFQYQNARQNYKNIDKLIKHANERLGDQGINVFYSTPSCYIKALHEESIRQNFTAWPTKTDDFFPYASGNHSYWTGYFTSRPTLKYMERYTNGLLQVAKQVEAMFENPARISGSGTDIDVLRRAMGAMQHHDAVTGTEKQHVADDYALLMSEGTTSAMSIVGPALFGLTGLVPPLNYNDFLCPLLNVSQCHLTENNERLAMIVYNPLARSVSKIVKFPIPSGKEVKIYNSEGDLLNVNIIPIPEQVMHIPGRQSLSEFEAVFLVSDIPALGFREYFVTIESVSSPKVSLPTKVDNPEKILKDLGIGVEIQYYLSSLDTAGQQSGAYVFRPNTSEKTTVLLDQVEVVETDLVVETRLSSSSSEWASVVARQYLGESHLEFEWLVGPLPELGTGIEVVATYKPQGNVSSRAHDRVEFWTDSNGRQMVYRIKDFRFSYDLNFGDLEPVSSNYYPVTTAIKTKLTESSTGDEFFTILNDRSQGGSCLNINECELMVHRRTFFDDGFGVGEALDEHAHDLPLVARGKHQVFVGPSDMEAEWRRSLSQELYMTPFLFFLPTDMTLESWMSMTTVKEFRGLQVESLPSNVHILTLEQWGNPKNNEILVRFEHLYEAGEHSELSKPVTIELTEDFFTNIRIANVREMSLGGTVDLGTMKGTRLYWKNQMKPTMEGAKSKALPMSITLEPMEIRTFILEVSARQRVRADVDALLELVFP